VPAVGSSTPDQIEHRFAGTVRTDQRDDLARVDLQRHLVDRHQAAEAARHVFHLKQDLACRRNRALRQRRHFGADHAPRRP
jgi:hypothetical protein